VKKFLAFALKVAVTSGLIWLVLRDQDLSAVGDRLSEISFVSILGAIALIAGQNVLAVRRWVIVMGLFGRTLPYHSALRFYFEGLFFNQALPSTVGGDGVRMYRAIKAGLPVANGVNGVLLDRIAGLFALLGIVALTQPWLYDRIDDTSARLAFAVVIAVGVGGILVLVLCGRMPGGLMRWRAARGLVGLSNGLTALFRNAAAAVEVFGLSFIGHLMMVSAIFILTLDLQLNVSFLDCLILVPGVMLLAAAPISIAGWGVRESVMIVAMALVGAPEAGSLGLSLVYGVIMILIGLVGGVLWLVNSDLRVSDIESATEEAAIDR
jgi:uncharacterized membrane protein YbhN (UPF0104 family)